MWFPVNIISVGLDVQCRYTPLYLGGTKRILNNISNDDNQELSQVRVSYSTKLQSWLEDFKLTSYRMQCMSRHPIGI